jgi:tetratricopeptide (TPR) repeat protein
VAPERIGRYRITRTLGIGGMGAVYAGFDDTLQRLVAIKGLLGHDSSPERRQRLRREAIAIAALSHPSIAHVYEIVTESGRDWVVMELVEGRSLAEVIADGPLRPEEVGRTGARIAEALAEAHRHGIVHRDVKADNVMLDADGNVKVLDFGLAIRFEPGSGGDSRLTADGMVVGTAKSMSPEQATGRPVDARSDIFALGSLLYELATGTPAFNGDTAMEIMVKVARNERAPVREPAPDLPTGLAEVIERCLQRDPDDRFQTAAEVQKALEPLRDPAVATPPRGGPPTAVRRPRPWLVGAGAAATLALLAVAARKFGWRHPRPPLAVAILPIKSEGPVAASVLTTTAVMDAIASHLVRLRGVVVVSNRDVRSAVKPGVKLPRLAEELGVDEFIQATVDERADSTDVGVTVERLDGRSGGVRWIQRTVVGTNDLSVLEDRIAAAIADGFRQYTVSSAIGKREASDEALRAFLEGSSHLDSGRVSKRYGEEIALFERAIALSPRFLEPRLALANIERYLYQLTREKSHLVRAEEFLAQANRLAPDDPRVDRLTITLELATGDAQGAYAHALALVDRRRADPEAWAVLAQTLQELGRYDEAEQAYARSLRLQPAWTTLYSLADMRIRRGDYARARATLNELLGRSPDNLLGLSKLAEVEFYSGNLSQAERLYTTLMKRRGSRVDKNNLAGCLFYEGDYDRAEGLYREMTQEYPQDALPMANLADTHLWQGNRELALSEYRKALTLTERQIAAGINDYDVLETRARCLAQLGRASEAVMAVDDALRLYPDNPQTRFVAALVFAVNGDVQLSLAWTRKAREVHAPVVWFSGPEFNALRGLPEFDALVQNPG